MSNKVKAILIAVELCILLAILLLGIGCQQRWIIVTGDGPRFDWYALIETQPPTEDEPEDTTGETEPSGEETTKPEPSTTVATRPAPTTEPSTEPEESTEEATEPIEETTEPTEDATEPTNSGGTREDELPCIPIS